MSSKRTLWTQVVGNLVIAAGEVDFLLYEVYQKQLGKDLNHSWWSATFSDRLKKISDELGKRPSLAPFADLLTLLNVAKDVAEKRNFVSHAAFALYGQQEAGVGELDDLCVIRYNKKTKEMDALTFKDVQAAADVAQQLSNDLSEFLSTGCLASSGTA